MRARTKCKRVQERIEKRARVRMRARSLEKVGACEVMDVSVGELEYEQVRERNARELRSRSMQARTTTRARSRMSRVFFFFSDIILLVFIVHVLYEDE